MPVFLFFQAASGMENRDKKALRSRVAAAVPEGLCQSMSFSSRASVAARGDPVSSHKVIFLLLAL